MAHTRGHTTRLIYPPAHPPSTLFFNPPYTPNPPIAAAPVKTKTAKGAKIADLDADEAGKKFAALSVSQVGKRKT